MSDAVSDIVFMDTETLGLHPDAPIWEFAAIRRFHADPVRDGQEEQLQMFIRHPSPYPWLDQMPEKFAKDYAARFDPLAAVEQFTAAAAICRWTEDAHIVGAVPNFDTERLARLLQGKFVPKWHYHLIDVENLVVGYLAAKGELQAPPWNSDELSRAIGVDPEQFDRHTAMGDVLWVRAQYDAVMGIPETEAQ